jgi:Uncharacterized protein conserved in bacteria
MPESTAVQKAAARRRTISTVLASTVLLATVSTFCASASAASPAQEDVTTASTASTAPQAPVVPPQTNTEAVTEAAPAVGATDSGEIRAMWVVRDSMTSPEKIRNTVALAKKHGFNTLFVQVRGRGDAFYDSRFEPRSESLAKAPSDFDPLQVAIDEGHAAGLEVHAWMNTFLVWHMKRRPWSQKHIVNRHLDWLVQDKNGKIAMTEQKDCEGAFLNPALPEVREYTKQVFLDVVSRYNVDGIHFDYVRYPSERFSFSRRDLALFREYLLPTLAPSAIEYADLKAKNNRLAWYYLFPKEWKRWRQENVSATVRAISEEAHRLKPNLIVSAAVFPGYSVASIDKGQAWHEWLRDDILDAACPMTYSNSTATVAAQIRDAVENSHGKPIIAGVGAWRIPADSAIAKGQAYRSVGAAGINFFSYDGMTRAGRTERYLAKVGQTLFPSSRSAPPNWRRGAKKRTEAGNAP